jgi:hypothetical protein
MRNMTEVNKRLISSSGRLKRVLLLDNIEGNFECAEFADMITQEAISGRPAYGRKEESRLNNIVYTITSNSARLSSDLVDRAYYIFVKKAKVTSIWRTELTNYIKDFRYKIMADIIDILEQHVLFDYEPTTRFPEFETQILQAFCPDIKSYQDVLAKMKIGKDDSSLDEEKIEYIKTGIRRTLINLHQNPDKRFFVNSEILNYIFPDAKENGIRSIVHAFADFSRQGDLPVCNTIRKYPKSGPGIRRGFMWNYEVETPVKRIGKDLMGGIVVINDI